MLAVALPWAVCKIGLFDSSGVRTIGRAACGVRSLWDPSRGFDGRSALGDVRKIGCTAGDARSDLSGACTMGRTAGGVRASVAARGVRTTGRAARGVRTMVSEHDLEGLMRGSAGAWGCMGLV